MGSTGAARAISGSGNLPFESSTPESPITPAIAMRIAEAAWGEDAMVHVLSSLSDKLDAYDQFAPGQFDVSYQGGLTALRAEIKDIFTAAGVDIRVVGKNILVYDNHGMEVRIRIGKSEDASTYTPKSKGYFIYVDNIE